MVSEKAIIFFCFWTITEHVRYPSRTLPTNPRYIRTSSRWWVLLLEKLWLVSDRIVNFRFIVKFDRSRQVCRFSIFHHTWQVRTCSFWTITQQMSYPVPINPMNIRTLSRCCLLLSEGISMISKKFVVFPLFQKTWQVWTCNFWTIIQQVSYPQIN